MSQALSTSNTADTAATVVSSAASTAVRATVRLQLHKGFTFDDAAATIDYYAGLGISHFYLSPIFAAREGSTHGYDVVDPTRISPELGGEAGFRQLAGKLRAAGLGIIIDIVPNHMGVASSANPYWQDVLAWGAQSEYAHWFDIEWQNPDPRLTGRLLLPVLGEPYEAALASGVLEVRFDADAGKFSLSCYDNLLPLSAASYAVALRGQPLFEDTADRFASLAPSSMAQAHEQLAALAATPDGQVAMKEVIARFAPHSPAGPAALHALLDRQHYRLSWWRNAAEEINWRRFFEVSDLAGVCVEKDDVFEATHALAFELYREGLIDGVRIDHVDGLAAPGTYCRAVRTRLAVLQPERPGELAASPAWIVVEKILTPGEALRSDWGVDGTTGYDFMDQVGAVLHDPHGERELRTLWRRVTQDAASFDDHVRLAREQLLAENFVGEVDALAWLLQRYAATIGVAGRDVAPAAIRRVLVALLVSFRRYRCYLEDSADAAYAEGAPDVAPASLQADGPPDPEDQAVLREAFYSACHRLHFHDHALLREVTGWLGMAEPGAVAAVGDPALQRRAIRRSQQLTPPLAAKSVEDTAFYRHAPLLSRNEVGSYPMNAAPDVAAFHAANVQRAAAFPRSMIATATHDHKRGEDSRARLAVLTEIPGIWSGLVGSWMSAHQHLRATVPLPGGGLLASPAAPDEVILYQAIFGAWPQGLGAADKNGLRALADRLAAWQEKALRESKTYSTWMLPQRDYEAACKAFLDHLLCGEAGAEFRSQMQGLVEKTTPAAIANSLTQTALRLMSPGIPDLYQGTDGFDFSLVDPDNRRPVDMAARRTAKPDSPLADNWQDDLGDGAKAHLIRMLLALRREQPDVFYQGNYVPLEVTGDSASHVIAFARTSAQGQLVTVALRHAAIFEAQSEATQAESVWGDTRVILPAGTPGQAAQWRDVLGGAVVEADAAALHLSQLLDRSTVCVLQPFGLTSPSRN
ncbi:MAG: malto-oligosyltrehalose synthase [Comamonadaceae bacterium]|nr:MAG: malto-oligosyltrehalose synthase [Comamonadaceae bacterium]